MAQSLAPSAPPSPGSAASLRVANQRRVLAELRDRSGGSVSQADLVRLTGLASGTVSTIVRDLAASGIVTTVAGSGRRGTAVRLAPGAGLVVGIDFGHHHVAAAVGDMAGSILAEARQPLDPNHEATDGLTIAKDLMDALVHEAGTDRKAIRNIGLGLPAPIANDIVMSSAILPGWVGLNARATAAEVLAAPVLIENDANLGALAEWRHGHGRGHRNLVFVKASSGLGAGLILDGELFRGSDGTAGEIGHVTVDERGPLCRCGSRGCLEAYVSSRTALALMEGHMPGSDLDAVIAAARSGDVAARRVIEDAGLHLGWGLAALVNLVAPDVVIVGGDTARAGDLLLEPALNGMRRHALPDAAPIDVVAAHLGERASLIGALTLAIDATDLVRPT
jgi:predicted NBD/HSP70 family sugar kinase